MKSLREKSTSHWLDIWDKDIYVNKKNAGYYPIEKKIFREILGECFGAKKYLEAGSGTGKISSLIAANGGDVTLLDISSAAINFSKLLHLHCQ